MVMDRFDLLIVGGGSSGAALAYEAVRRGLRVALLEAGDPGQGTSSRSTKLLHGGVRYLELAFKQLDAAQLKLVREALSERQYCCLLYTSPSPRDQRGSRMPSSA